MPRTSDSVRKTPVVPLVAGAIVIVCAVLVVLYFSRPSNRPGPDQATAEAKAYLPNLGLSDVSMEASENFMKQQVVEVKGNIANNGAKILRSIEVYCIFSDVSGHEIHRERQSIVSTKEAPLRPGERRPFRLPFDALPDGWNQAMPRLVIAQIRFSG
jgi:hypothetical protein